MTIRDKIWVALKKGNKSLSELYAAIPDEKSYEIKKLLDEFVEKKYLAVENGVYRIRFRLESWKTKADVPTSKARTYESIRAKESELAGSTIIATAAPPSFRNQFINDVVHRGQGNTGTCVGQATAYAADLNYIQLTGDRPTDADRAHAKFNVRLDPNNPNNTTYYDILYTKSFAAAFPYWRSRIRCNVTVPSGSYVSCAMPTWRDEGICLNDQWYLSKDGRTAWREPYPDKHPVTGETVASFAPKHKIDGYASVMTKTGIMDAISKYGFVVGAIVVYENFTQMDPNTGIFPDPKGASVGGHALCFIGYDANYLYCLHSWRDELPAKVGGISWSYFSTAGIEFFTALDSKENAIVVDPLPTPPVASFTANPNSGEAPLTVQFIDTSTGTVDSRAWDFGDGTTATEPAVSHTYASAGDYTATLKVSNSGGFGAASMVIKVLAPPEPPVPAPVAKIVATPQAGQVPLTVQFFDRSEGTVEKRAWDFGDGTLGSTDTAPTHTYVEIGRYTATLKVSNVTGESTATVVIDVAGKPVSPWERFIKWLIDFINGLFNRQ